MKKIVFFAVCLFALTSLNAQESGRLRLGANLGYAHPKGGHGGDFSVELKYNISDNFNIGFNVDYSFSIKTINDEAADIAGTAAYLGTADFYLHSNETSNFAPFFGVGLGNYRVASVTKDINGMTYTADPSSKFGWMLRAGFESGRFRLTGNYNFIPKSKAKSDSSPDIFEVENAYFSITLGFYFGGGHWRKY